MYSTHLLMPQYVILETDIPNDKLEILSTSGSLDDISLTHSVLIIHSIISNSSNDYPFAISPNDDSFHV